MINKFFRSELQNFKEYIPSPTLQQIGMRVGITPEKIIKIDSGENPYVEKYQNKNKLKKIKFSLYPDPVCRNLRQKLASYMGFDPDWIMCGNGSDELIDLLIRASILPKDQIIVSPPTFSMYEFYGQLSGAKIKKILRRKDFSIDTVNILKMINSKTKIIFIDSPGNPSSVISSPEEIEKILKKQTLVVVDEAYFEYCGKTVLPLVRKYPNLIVLRSLSKWAGLAGMRVGYMVANPEIIKILLLIKPPYNVNSVAQEMACDALDNKEKLLAEIKDIVGFRQVLIRKLCQFKNFKVYPSEGAYVLFKPDQAEKLQKYLRKNGILVKLINQPRLENCIRINLIKEPENNKLIILLRRFYEN